MKKTFIPFILIILSLFSCLEDNDILSPNGNDTLATFNKPAEYEVLTTTFNEAVTTVEINAEYDIFYTLDGTTPDTNSRLYTGSFSVDTSIILKTYSPILQTYSPEENPIKVNTIFVGEATQLPIVSISVDDSAMFDSTYGIYMMGPDANPEKPYRNANFWKDIELPVEIEMYNAGEIQFKEKAGLKLFGSWSRTYPKKSLAINFRSEYGSTKLNYKLFDHLSFTKYDAFVLRNNGQNFASDVCKDGIIENLSSRIGLHNRAFKPAILYINGKYWGIHNIREKIDKDYFENHFNITDGTLNLIKDWDVLEEGSAAGFESIKEFIETNDMSIVENYSTVEKSIDIENYIDYLFFEMYVGNTDWPGNNKKVWQSDSYDEKWRWVIYDLDFGFAGNSRYSLDMFEYLQDSKAYIESGSHYSNSNSMAYEYILKPEYADMYKSMIMNKDFRDKYVSRSITYLNTELVSDKIITVIDSIVGLYDTEMEREMQRWNYSSTLEKEADIMREFAEERKSYFLKHMKEAFDLEDDVKITFDIAGNGAIEIDKIKVKSYPYSASYYEESLLTLSIPEELHESFISWENNDTNRVRIIDPEDVNDVIVAKFAE